MDNFSNKDKRILELNNQMKLLISKLNEILSRLLFAIEVLKKSGKSEISQTDLEMLYNLQQEYLDKYSQVEIIINELRNLLIDETPNTTELLMIYRRYLNLANGNDLFTEN